MFGQFLEKSVDDHCIARQRILRQKLWFPSMVESIRMKLDNLDAVVAILQAEVSDKGMAYLEADRLLENYELTWLASKLGRVESHRDSRLNPWIEDGTILNVRADNPEILERDWQLLFASNYVMMHTELSNRPLIIQPRYLLFQCVQAPEKDEGGQTLLVPMSNIAVELGDNALDTLSSTHVLQAGHNGAPPIVTVNSDGVIFSYKDVEGEAVPWVRNISSTPGVTEQDVNMALRRLLALMYDDKNVRGIQWSPLGICVIDNHRLFHGRSAISVSKNGKSRHLRQIKVYSSETPPVVAVGQNSSASKSSE